MGWCRCWRAGRTGPRPLADAPARAADAIWPGGERDPSAADLDDGLVVGVVSSRDICSGDRTLNAALAALRSDLAEGRFRPVSSVMSTPARTVRPQDTIGRATQLMLNARIGALPVVAETVPNGG